MRITNEADYALRIVCYLGNEMQKANAKDISEKTGVTLRFALKILRKLGQVNIVGSKQGASGGYFLKKPAAEVSVGEIIEVIDGEIRINSCLHCGYTCTQIGDEVKNCKFYNCFCEINKKLREELYSSKLSSFMECDTEQ